MCSSSQQKKLWNKDTSNLGERFAEGATAFANQTPLGKLLFPEDEPEDIPEDAPIPLLPNTAKSTQAAIDAQTARAARLRGQQSTITTTPLGLSAKALTSKRRT